MWPHLTPALHFAVRELKDRLSGLLRRAIAGEEIIVTSHRRPIARLGPVAANPGCAAANHRLAYVEIYATLAKAVRTGRLELSSLDPRLREFDDRWGSLEVVEATETLAVHETLGESVAYGFAATDGRLNDAARLVGRLRGRSSSPAGRPA